MTTKKPDTRSDYDFRAGVRGKHLRPMPADPAPHPAHERVEPAPKERDAAAKPVKR
jgi:hypothetical protein